MLNESYKKRLIYIMGIKVAASVSCPEGSVFPRAFGLPFDDSKIDFSSVSIAQNIETLIYTGST